MTHNINLQAGPTWRRVLLTLALAFSIPALLGGIIGLFFVWRAQPLRAELEVQRAQYQRLHHRFDRIGNLDKLAVEVLPRKGIVEALDLGSDNAEAIRDLLKTLPPEVHLVSLTQAILTYREGGSWKSRPALAMSLQLPDPSASAAVTDLLNHAGFSTPRIQSLDKSNPDKVIAEFSADLPLRGPATGAP